jgi:hypothetical protein
MSGGFAGEADQLRPVFPVGVFPAYQAALLSWTPGRICHMLAVAKLSHHMVAADHARTPLVRLLK